MAKTKVQRPTRDELAKYFDLDQKRLAANREANDLRKLQDEIEEKVLAYVRENGGEERCCIVCGYRLSIELKNGRVEWNKAYLEAMGQEQAEELRKAAGKVEAAKIEAPA